MSVTKQQLEDHAKLVQQKLGIVVKTEATSVAAVAKADVVKAGSWFTSMATTESTKFEALVKTHPAVLGLIVVSVLLGFVIGFFVGKF